MFSIKKGSLLPVMLLSTTEDLTGATGLGVRWRSKVPAGTKVDGGGTVTLVSAGSSGSVVSYGFAAGETDTEGLYDVEITASIGGKPIVVPELGFGQFRVVETIE